MKRWIVCWGVVCQQWRISLSWSIRGMIIDKTMRLYPTVWQLMRHTIQDDVINDYHIPAGYTVFWSNYMLHRHPAIWEDGDGAL
ncbi:cytochrome P450 [Ktedonospora formicarum]